MEEIVVEKKRGRPKKVKRSGNFNPKPKPEQSKIDYDKFVEYMRTTPSTLIMCASTFGVTADVLNNWIRNNFPETPTWTSVRDLLTPQVFGEVARKQVELAKSGNVEMLKWVGKNYMGQSDSARIEFKNNEDEDDEFTKSIKASMAKSASAELPDDEEEPKL